MVISIGGILIDMISQWFFCLVDTLWEISSPQPWFLRVFHNGGGSTIIKDIARLSLGLRFFGGAQKPPAF